MLRAFTIQNFKCFHDITVAPLAQVNLVVGRNNVGKTSFLEALFLHAGYFNVDLATRISAIRGVTRFKMTPEGIWGWLFRNRQLETTILLKGMGESGEETTLALSLARTSRKEVSADTDELGRVAAKQETTTSPEGMRALLYQYDSNGDKRPPLRGFIDPQGKIVNQADPGHDVAAHYLGSRSRYNEEDAQFFGQLVQKKQKQKVLDVVQRLGPDMGPAISDIGVTPDGFFLSVDLPELPELLPVPYAGEGLAKFTSFVVRILTLERGLVLVDEIENGFHHTAMLKVWESIGALLREHPAIQMVATTHSYECLKAAHEAFEGADEDAFRVFRFERRQDEINAKAIDRRSREILFESGMEIR